MGQDIQLLPGITLIERGWLSSNNVLLQGPDDCTLVDSGYASQAAQTLALVTAALKGRRLDRLLNTHLHSDHCGGNACLQAHFGGLQTLIAPGQARHVAAWDARALSYTPTGQICPPFTYSATLEPGTELDLGGWRWQIHAAPGHDPDSVMLFQPGTGLLLSADALWENGFGVVFPALLGDTGFAEVAQTLDLIESLAPEIIIPGHGAAFADVAGALARSRKRLDSFVSDPAKHIRHAAKVLIKFKLLELQNVPMAALLDWAAATELVALVHQRDAPTQVFAAWIEQLVDDLARSGAARREQDRVHNA